jgi:acyl transferase domain-containing protein
LQRLSDAIADKDNIQGVIRASGVNQSSEAASLTTPHPETLASLFTRNLERAGVDPSTVVAVETHGTGTKAGDPAEVAAIAAAFGKGRNVETNPLYIAGLKPNIGHSESASGISSLMKALMMMRKRSILPHIGVTTGLNPKLGDLAAAGLKIPSSVSKLTPAPGHSRLLMSINNFGAPGGFDETYSYVRVLVAHARIHPQVRTPISL